MSVPLSVVILTKNESSRIRDCIESVRWADEILVIDDESTDDTVQVAESLGARVLRRKMDIEGRHRNWAHAQTTHQWILSLDADERVTPELAREIVALLTNGAPYELYAIPRRNYLGNRWLRHGGWYPSAQLKLFKKSVFRWEETTVHPRAFANCACGSLRHDLLHFSYRDEQDFIKKLDRQTTLEAQKWLADGRRVSLGKALWRTIDRAVRSYILKCGFLDGRTGLFTAWMAGRYQWTSFRKYTELKRSRRAADDGPLTLGRALWRTVAGFGRAYWFQRGQRDDWRRLCAAVTAEMHRWLALMKRWERSLPQSAPSEPLGWQRGEARHASGVSRERLTILLMTKNEERRIERCLESVSWADQIVVVDGESTDRTVELCRRFGAEVVVRPFNGSFAEERNAGLEVATGDWILQMDADEIVTPDLREALERMLTVRDGRYQAYQVRRRNIFLGRFMRYGGWYHNHLCVFLREGHRYHGLVHERLNIDGPIGHLNADIQHEPFQSIEQFITRHNRYTTLQARELFETKGRLPWRTVSRALQRRPLKRFWKFYVKKQGFREGMHGLVFSTLYAWVEFLYWVKYCELAYPPPTPAEQRHG